VVDEKKNEDKKSSKLGWLETDKKDSNLIFEISGQLKEKANCRSFTSMHRFCFFFFSSNIFHPNNNFFLVQWREVISVTFRSKNQRKFRYAHQDKRKKITPKNLNSETSKNSAFPLWST
jgi:hypothetical protein